MSKVSVIIVNFNAGDILRQAIQMLLRSKEVSEVFVIDNASTDKSMEAVERLAVLQSRLKCIYNKSNVGFAKACNIGIDAASGDYLLFLNPDCFIAPEALETLLACMHDFPQAGMVGPLVLNSDGSEQAGSRRAVPTPWRSFVRAFGLAGLGSRYPKMFSDFLLHEQPLPAAPVEVEAISGSCMLVRQSALPDIGNMDENYFMHCEDLDWCMRFRRKGWKVIFVPAARVDHHKGVCSNSRPLFVEWHKHKGMIRFYRKFFYRQYPGILWWLVIMGVWLRFGLVAIYYSAKHVRRGIKN